MEENSLKAALADIGKRGWWNGQEEFNAGQVWACMLYLGGRKRIETKDIYDSGPFSWIAYI